jgi:hypothetical protein
LIVHRLQWQSFVADVEHSIVDSWWDWHVLENPEDVFSDWHVNWWEEVLAEQIFLCLVPSESILVNHHKMVHESLFLGGEEAVRVVLLNDVEAGLVVVASGREVNREWR